MILNKIDTRNLWPEIPPLVGNESPISILPPEMFIKIFSHTNLAAFSAGSKVSKKCDTAIKSLENDPLQMKKVFYQTVVFGNKQWALCGGEEIVKDEDMDEEFQSLSAFMDEILKCKPFVGKKMSDVLDEGVFVRRPKALTLEIIGKLAKPYFPDSEEDGYGCCMPLDKKDEPEESYWIWMSKIEIPYTARKSFPVQQKMAADLGYKDPKVLEAVACLFAKYCLSKTRLYKHTWTHCQSKINGFPAVVGFAPKGLYVGFNNFGLGPVGIAGLLRSGHTPVVSLKLST